MARRAGLGGARTIGTPGMRQNAWQSSTLDRTSVCVCWLAVGRAGKSAWAESVASASVDAVLDAISRPSAANVRG